jgi:hypothetical protein
MPQTLNLNPKTLNAVNMYFAMAKKKDAGRTSHMNDNSGNSVKASRVEVEGKRPNA